jgi:formylglycine-generating enzyme required for sulfatase activity/uncharacterized caspase-like protein
MGMGKFALLIGVGSYRSSDLHDLLAAPRDVEAMQRVLVDEAIGGFAVEDVCVLQNPGSQDMRVAIARLFAGRTREDLLLLYFSGHGLADEGLLHLTATDTDKSLLDATAIPASFIHGLMERRGKDRSQYQVVILDCCYSGAFAKGMAAKGSGVNLLSQLGGKGRAVLTSSSETEPSFEQKDGELSVYTQYVVEGLRTGIADKDEDGWISVDELHEFAAMKVREAAPAMQPKIYAVEEGYKIFVAKAPVGDPKLAFRKEVEKLAKERKGVISPILKAALVRGSEGKVSEEDIAEILKEVLQPYREFEDRLQEFQKATDKFIILPPEQQIIADLIYFQKTLGLRDEDVGPKPKPLKKTRKISTYSNVLSSCLDRRSFLRLTYAGLGLGGGWIFSRSGQLWQSKSSPNSVSTPGFLGNQKAAAPSQPLARQIAFPTVQLNSIGQITQRLTGQAMVYSEKLSSEIILDMVKIPAGKFMMGSPSNELERESDEGPVHSVTVPEFWMGQFEVTQAQWRQVAAMPKVSIILNEDPSNFKGVDLPVEQVSWDEATEFCSRLSRATKRIYRLPSEAEWEYACRAGMKTPFYFGPTISPEVINYDGNYTYGQGSKGEYRQGTTNVGSFPANAFGLYDMHGNVWEWCHDIWQADYSKAPTDGSAQLNQQSDKLYRLLRGGSWYNDPWDCRSANRSRYSPDDRDLVIGFRVACSLAS